MRRASNIKNANMKSLTNSTDPIFWKKVKLLWLFILRKDVDISEEAFEFITAILTPKERMRIAKGIVKFNEEVHWNTTEEFDEFAEALEKGWWRSSFGSMLRKRTTTIIEDKLNSARVSEKSLFLSKLKEVKKTFSLSDEEVELLFISYLVDNDEDFGSIFSISHCDRRGKLKLFAKTTRLNERALRKLTNEDAPLVKFNILDRDLDLDSDLSRFLEGMYNKPLISSYFKEVAGGSLSLQEFDQVAEHVEIVKALLQKRESNEKLNILIYGAPGTGKTEFAKSLAGELEYTLYQIEQPTSSRDEQNSHRIAGVQACLNSVDLAKSIVLIDEADEILNGSGGLMMFSRNVDKGAVNDLLDESNGVCVWITNTHEHIAPSTKRRFDYSIEFPNMSLERRKRIWTDNIAKMRLKRFFKEKDTARLAKEYDLNVGGIILALTNLKKVARKADKGFSATESIESIIKAHMKIMNIPLSTNATRVKEDEEYCLEALNHKSAFPLNSTIEMLKNFHSTLSGEARGSYARNLNMLLFGPPGTGKTEFAKFAAREIGCRLIVRNASDLLNKFVGGTEQNIRNAFAEAETEKAVLLIDEADGLISERSNAMRNWEVTQVNEFLSRMEQFRGILMCATNFKKNVDAAAIRRFGIKIEFDYLLPEGKISLYKKILLPMTKEDIGEGDIARIADLDNLTPGDFKVVRQKFAFLPGKQITHQLIIDALQEEAESKNNLPMKVIGFHKASA